MAYKQTLEINPSEVDMVRANIRKQDLKFYFANTSQVYLILGMSSICEYCFACNPSPLLFPPTDTIPLRCSPSNQYSY